MVLLPFVFKSDQTTISPRTPLVFTPSSDRIVAGPSLGLCGELCTGIGTGQLLGRVRAPAPLLSASLLLLRICRVNASKGSPRRESPKPKKESIPRNPRVLKSHWQSPKLISLKRRTALPGPSGGSPAPLSRLPSRSSPGDINLADGTEAAGHQCVPTLLPTLYWSECLLGSTSSVDQLMIRDPSISCAFPADHS